MIDCYDCMNSIPAKEKQTTNFQGLLPSSSIHNNNYSYYNSIQTLSAWQTVCHRSPRPPSIATAATDWLFIRIAARLLPVAAAAILFHFHSILEHTMEQWNDRHFHSSASRREPFVRWSHSTVFLGLALLLGSHRFLLPISREPVLIASVNSSHDDDDDDTVRRRLGRYYLLFLSPHRQCGVRLIVINNKLLAVLYSRPPGDIIFIIYLPASIFRGFVGLIRDLLWCKINSYISERK